MAFNSTGGGATPDNVGIELNSSAALSLKDGGITADKIGTDLEKWDLLDTLSPSGVNNIGSTGLPVRKRYKCVYVDLEVSTIGLFQLQLNGDTGNNYTETRINNITREFVTGSPQIILAQIGGTAKISGETIINGKTKAVASGVLGMVHSIEGHGGAGAFEGLSSQWIGGNNIQVDEILFAMNGGVITFSGTILIFGSDQ